MSQTIGIIQDPQFLRSQVVAQQALKNSNQSHSLTALVSTLLLNSFSRQISFSRRYPYCYFSH